MERHFQEKIPFERHSRKKFATCCDFEKPIYFSERTPKFERFENSFYSSRILRINLLQISEKKNSRSEVNTIADVGVNAMGKHRVK